MLPYISAWNPAGKKCKKKTVRIKINVLTDIEYDMGYWVFGWGLQNHIIKKTDQSSIQYVFPMTSAHKRVR